MITERTLTKWRKEALLNVYPEDSKVADTIYELNQRILRLTQELLDAHLIRNIRK